MIEGGDPEVRPLLVCALNAPAACRNQRLPNLVHPLRLGAWGHFRQCSESVSGPARSICASLLTRCATANE